MAIPRCSRSPRAILAAGLMAAGITFVPTTSAFADPPPPATASDAQQELGALGHQAEVLTEAMHDGQIAVDTATDRATEAAAAEHAAAAASERAEDAARTADAAAGDVVSASYEGGRTDPLMALMTSTGPQDMLDKMSGLEWLAGDAGAKLQTAVEASRDAADKAARAKQATDETANAAQQATRALDELNARKQELDGKIATWQATFDRLDAQEKAEWAAAQEPVTPAVAPVVVGGGGGDAAAGRAATSGGSSDQGAETEAVAAAPTATQSSGSGSSGSGSGSGSSALDAAKSKIGSPYVWGASGPNSFDCSGLTSWAYAQAGITLPRSSRAQAAGGTAVSQANLRPGDLVFFYSPVSHVGIYAGDGMVVHAPTAGQSVKMSSMSQMPYNSARRY